MNAMMLILTILGVIIVVHGLDDPDDLMDVAIFVLGIGLSVFAAAYWIWKLTS